MSLEQLLAWIPAGSADETLAHQVNFERLPSHVAIIMDGNGRWAAQRHLPRVEGHRAGIDSVRDVVETSARLGIGVLTLLSLDSSGNVVGPHFDLSFTSTTWTPIAGTYVAPAGSIRIALLLQSAGSGTFWFDDTSLKLK